ncbi:KH domain-containing, RNA-binding, signal transduction-associated protein 2-like isoform X2 [Pieris napi]|uniref:KH domain-containing, RNA-binding, signal transduction-associated protein 2-like isoform X2 n=1 Tax=Pieris napi TaxID=78633 RepID=UPI001FB9251C|nr:KH domain-containing, RNA-binding, signal transduction-associated protein 2-like isoform X2 [Pieris napi]
MADKFDNGSEDFKRNSNPGNDHEQDGEEVSKLNEKAGEYMRDLLSEKIKLPTNKFPVSCRLIDQEVERLQASGRIPLRDNKYVDVFREKPVKVTVKVLVPIKEHPKFNFVGKLLGPKGNTMKQLQEETMCKMAILGRGSMRDRNKEEELRNSLDPKYAHLSDELHVEVSALAPPAEAHARIAYALAEVKKYLIADGPDMMRPPMREMMDRDPGSLRAPLLQLPEHSQGAKAVVYSARTLTNRSVSYQGPVTQGAPPPMSRPPAPRMPPARSMAPAKTKVFSILDRARNAMESSYGYDDYSMQEPSRPPPPNRQAPDSDFYYERGGGSDQYYEEDNSYYKSEEPREYKATARDVGTRRSGPPATRNYNRPAPYQRQQKTHKKHSQ